MSGALQITTLVTALGCGLTAGVWFAFSTFVMPALDRLPATQAVTAMQSINKLAITPLFMTAVFGTALACLGLVVWGAVSGEEPAAPWVIAGSTLYLIGTFAVTSTASVPLNNTLATVRPESPDAAGRWSKYVRDWTAWNHVRAVTSLGAVALLTIALSLD